MSTVTATHNKLTLWAIEVHALDRLIISVALVTMYVVGTVRVLVTEQVDVLIIVCAQYF